MSIPSKGTPAIVAGKDDILSGIMRFMGTGHRPIKSQPPIGGWYIKNRHQSDMPHIFVRGIALLLNTPSRNYIDTFIERQLPYIFLLLGVSWFSGLLLS